MQVRVLFFGVLKDLAGRSSDVLTLPERSRAADVIEHYEHQLPSLKGIFSSIAVSVNQRYASAEEQLSPGDEIGLLPPVSGGSAPYGSDNSALRAPADVRIVRPKIDSPAFLAGLKQPEDGALVSFEGIVRNHTRGRATLFLEYEAYEAMALAELRSLAARALADFNIRQVAIVHRLGRIEIGETSVLIGVASAHRAPAFEACRWLIDTLKRTVPIWKKEYFTGGAVWADGEPFPEELAPGIHSSNPASN
ncbi:MAG: molybdenum cofactor biosynthesis protein MoaE [Acidobacteria bacterium]|nr:molybdenum cofactor biosynthesis protein MoaE [Acidobacteriota bacterium]